MIMTARLIIRDIIAYKIEKGIYKSKIYDRNFKLKYQVTDEQIISFNLSKFSLLQFVIIIVVRACQIQTFYHLAICSICRHLFLS